MATVFDPALDPVNAWPLEEQPEPVAFDEMELLAALKREFDAADSEYDRLRDIINSAHDYYEARPFGNEVEGRSQIILPDVQETIDYMVPSVLRTFLSGDRVVEFEATNQDDEHLADEATAAIGYNFMRQQDGYRILHDWLTCGLIERFGVAKTMVETQEKVTRDRIEITDPVELEGIDAEIEGITDNPDGTLSVSLKRTARAKRFIDLAVPMSEFRFSPNARHEDDADYLAHVPIKTRSELVDMGYDREQVYDAPAYTKIPEDRDRYEYWQVAESTAALQEIMYYEEYARIDIDGDGIAERVKVCRTENEILRYAVPYANGGELAIETVDEQPFTVFCPFPRPHRLVGWSLADKVMDIQLARSTIARQLLDGMYNANMPRPYVDMTQTDENTIDDLLSPIAGSPVRGKGPNAVTPLATAFDVGKSLTVMEWMTGERESRTGITRLNQGLDADALNKTATGTAMMQAQGQQQEEFIARNLAEALSRLMAKKYRLMRVEADPFPIKIDGKYKMVTPAKWPEDVNVTIRVGLGTGSKDKRIQGRMTLAPIMAEGFANKQVTPKHLFNAVDGLVRDLGLGQGDDFWVDPDSPEAAKGAEQEGPTPEQMEAQAKIQQEQQKLELEAAKSQAQLELSREESAAKIDLMREEGAQKLQLEREKARYEAEANQQRMEFEQAMAVRQQEFNERLAERKAEHDAAQAEAKVAANRPGGQLDK